MKFIKLFFKVIMWFVIATFIAASCVYATFAVLEHDYRKPAEDLYEYTYNKMNTTVETKESRVFKPMKIGFNIIIPKEYKVEYSMKYLILDNTIVSIPVPVGTEITTNYRDTIFADDGSAYIVMTKNDGTNLTNVNELKMNRSWPSKPMIFQVYPANCNYTIYIKCYDNKVAGFYRDFDYSQIRSFKSSVNYESLHNLKIPNNLYINFDYNTEYYLKDMILDLVLVLNNPNSFTDFIKVSEKGYINYYKAVYSMDQECTRIYCQMIDTGKRIQYIYRNKDYIIMQYSEDITIYIVRDTENSCFTYYVTNATNDEVRNYISSLTNG